MNGFIGRHVYRILKQRGNSVAGLSRSNGNRVNVVCDLTLPENLNSISRKFDYVVHLANESRGENDYLFVNNVFGTFNLLERMRQLGMRNLIYLSSHAVYPQHADYSLDESAIPQPSTYYGFTKQICEELCGFYREQYGFCVAVLRVSYVYGPYMNVETALAKFILQARANQKIVLHNNGEDTFDFVHVEDVARSVYDAMCSGANGTYNIGSGVPLKIRNVVDLIIKATNSKSQVVIEKGIASHHIINIGKAISELQFSVDMLPDRGITGLAYVLGKEEEIDTSG